MTMLVPMMSAGMRSGVNWIRVEADVDSASANVRISSVLQLQPRHPFQQRTGRRRTGQVRTPWMMVVVADDDLGDLGLDAGMGVAELGSRVSIEAGSAVDIGA